MEIGFPDWIKKKNQSYGGRTEFPYPHPTYPWDNLKRQFEGKLGFLKNRCWEIDQLLIKTGLKEKLDDARANGLGNLYWYRIPPSWLGASPNHFLIDKDSDIVQYELSGGKRLSDGDIDLSNTSEDAIGYGFAINAKQEGNLYPWRYFLIGQKIVDKKPKLFLYIGEINGKVRRQQQTELDVSNPAAIVKTQDLISENLAKFTSGEIPS